MPNGPALRFAAAAMTTPLALRNGVAPGGDPGADGLGVSLRNPPLRCSANCLAICAIAQRQVTSTLPIPTPLKPQGGLAASSPKPWTCRFSPTSLLSIRGQVHFAEMADLTM